jgi:hypothetical protein
LWAEGDQQSTTLQVPKDEFLNNSPAHTEIMAMTNENTDLLTAANIAKALGVSDARVKKAIQALGIKPQAKKGVCNYYSKDIVARIKASLK